MIAMALEVFKGEFKKSMFLYRHQDSRIFYICHWKWPISVFICFRVLLAVYTVFGLSYYLVSFTYFEDIKQSIMVYFTTWSYIVLTAHLLLAAVLSITFFKVMHYEQLLKLDITPCRDKSTASRHAKTTCDCHDKQDTKSLHISHQTTPHYTTTETKTTTTTTKTTTTSTSQPTSVKPLGSRSTPQSIIVNQSHAHYTISGSLVDQNSGKECSTQFQGASVEANGGLNLHNNQSSMYESFQGDPQFEDGSRLTSWYFQVSWALSDIVLCTAPIVTCVYFAFIYPVLARIWNDFTLSLSDINVHLLNSVFAIADFAFSARPVRLLHAWVPVAFGVSWMLFSVVYWAVDKENHVIYKFMDWNRPYVVLPWMVGLLVGCIFLLFVYFLLYRLKLKLFSVIYEHDYFIDINAD